MVPAERLLVWNVKDGWSPLCSFLNKPIPPTPFPHDNKGGDKEWTTKYFVQSQFFQEMMECMKWNSAVFIGKVAVLSLFVCYEYKQNGKHLKQMWQFGQRIIQKA